MLAIAWAVTSVTLFAVDPNVTAERTTIQALLSVAGGSAAITVVLGLFLGHLAMARLRWPGHFARLPRLIGEVWRSSASPGRPAGTGVVVGILVGLFVPPAVAAGFAATGIGLTVTVVGLAIVAGWQVAADEWRRVSLTRTGPTIADRRVALVTFGGAVAVTGIVRLLVLDGPCLLERLTSGPCGGPTVAVASAAVVGAVAVLPLFLGLGALVSLTLDSHDLADLAGVPDRGTSPTEVTSPEVPTSPEPSRSVEPAPAAVEEGPVDEEVIDEPAPSSPRPAPSSPRPAPPDENELALAAAAALAQVAEEDRAETDIAPETFDDIERDAADAVDPTDEITPVAIPEEDGMDDTEEGADDDTDEDGRTSAEIPATGDAATTAGRLQDVEHHLDRLSPHSRERLQPLLDDLAALPPDRARGIIDQISHHHGTVASLRTQYQRAPGIAKGAIERACISGLTVAGIPGDDAKLLASALLQLPEDDWEILTSVLTELEASLPDGDERPAT